MQINYSNKYHYKYLSAVLDSVKNKPNKRRTKMNDLRNMLTHNKNVDI